MSADRPVPASAPVSIEAIAAALISLRVAEAARKKTEAPVLPGAPASPSSNPKASAPTTAPKATIATSTGTTLMPIADGAARIVPFATARKEEPPGSPAIQPDTRPEPMTPADADLRSFPDMPVDVMSFDGGELGDLESAEAFRVAVIARMKAWHQRPAGSLPAEDLPLARLLGFGRDVRALRRARDKGALNGWTLCNDGRLYHPDLAARVHHAWQQRQTFRRKTVAGTRAAADAARVRRERVTRSDEGDARGDGDLRGLDDGAPVRNESAQDVEIPGNAIPLTDPSTDPSTDPRGEESREERRRGRESTTIPSHLKLAGSTNIPTELRSVGAQETVRKGQASVGREPAARADVLDAVARLLGITGKTAGPILGKLRKLVGNDDDDDLRAILAAAEAERPADPRAWILAAARAAGGRRKGVPRDAPPHEFGIYTQNRFAKDSRGNSLPVAGSVDVGAGRCFLTTAIEAICNAARIADPGWRGDWDTIVRWIDDGISIPETAIPAIEAVMERKSRGGNPTWRPAKLLYFDGAVRDRPRPEYGHRHF